MKGYVHGYSECEADRLADQASVLAKYLHYDSRFPAGSRVLEAGCGIGAQTRTLAAANPHVHFTSIDIDGPSLEKAACEIKRLELGNVDFLQADIDHLPFPAGQFDHVFCCFVLEHLPQPLNALRLLKDILKPAGTLMVIEGDHGSFFSHPETQESRRVVQCLVELQAKTGGDALIGRRLNALLQEAEFQNVQVVPRQVYADSSRPEIVEGFSKRTFIAMVQGVMDQTVSQGLLSLEMWEKGVEDLYAATGEDGIFCYTFFKAVAAKPKGCAK